MERLTKHSKQTSHENGICCTHFRSPECLEVGGNCAMNCKWEEAAWSRLAAYEDKELEPEEITAMQHTLDEYHKVPRDEEHLRERDEKGMGHAAVQPEAERAAGTDSPPDQRPCTAHSGPQAQRASIPRRGGREER